MGNSEIYCGLSTFIYATWNIEMFSCVTHVILSGILTGWSKGAQLEQHI